MEHTSYAKVCEMKWRSTKVAEPIFQRIEKIAPALGYASVAQFVGEAVHGFLIKKEREFDEREGDRQLGTKIREEQQE
jgi:hypothetical protein